MGKREAERRAKEQFDRAVRRRDALLEKHADVDDGYVAALKSKTDRYYAAKEKVAASRVQSGGSGGRFAVVAQYARCWQLYRRLSPLLRRTRLALLAFWRLPPSLLRLYAWRLLRTAVKKPKNTLAKNDTRK